MSERWIPKPYMKRAVRFMIERGAAGLFLDPGLRKTSITLAAFDLLRGQGLARGMLVVAPLRVCYLVWPAEARKWTDFSHLKVTVLHGPRKVEALRSGADVFVINPEGLEWLFTALGPRKDDWPFDILCLDESTKFKNTQTVRFKLLRKQLHKFRRRYILTGTPAPNGLHDLFGQIFVIDLGQSLGKYVTHYRMEFFDKTGYMGYHYVPRAGAEKKIYKRLAPYVLRMDAKDYLQLPPLIPVNVYVELPAKAREIYDRLENEFLLKFDGGEVSAANAATLGGKLRQIANGGIYLDEQPNEARRRVKELHTAKVEALVELMGELEGQSALIAYEFIHDARRYEAGLKKAGYKDVVVFGGGVSPKRTIEIQAAWDAGELQAIIAQPASVAWGLNLQATGRAVVWASQTWNLEHYDQFIRRLWRSGQRGRVFLYHLLARNTVDEGVINGLRGKDRTQRALLDALRAYSRARRRRD